MPVMTCLKNKNTHPGNILKACQSSNDEPRARQTRKPSAKVQKSSLLTQKEHEATIQHVADVEDTMQQSREHERANARKPLGPLTKKVNSSSSHATQQVTEGATEKASTTSLAPEKQSRKAIHSSRKRIMTTNFPAPSGLGTSRTTSGMFPRSRNLQNHFRNVPALSEPPEPLPECSRALGTSEPLPEVRKHWKYYNLYSLKPYKDDVEGREDDQDGDMDERPGGIESDCDDNDSDEVKMLTRHMQKLDHRRQEHRNPWSAVGTQKQAQIPVGTQKQAEIANEDVHLTRSATKQANIADKDVHPTHPTTKQVKIADEDVRPMHSATKQAKVADKDVHPTHSTTHSKPLPVGTTTHPRPSSQMLGAAAFRKVLKGVPKSPVSVIPRKLTLWSGDGSKSAGTSQCCTSGVSTSEMEGAGGTTQDPRPNGDEDGAAERIEDGPDQLQEEGKLKKKYRNRDLPVAIASAGVHTRQRESTLGPYLWRGILRDDSG
ncbi:hypothetical protein L210DRAFT_3644194 [Boletus edulis BED1]|uniref:Uncharacterized protein n=1 Tax=Boletus edulis BED1 TaxID=1328754 RepID=A0AAD4BX02_BOLED|nr:hypothetical protein L210DRAFT_3644194 [Boletus edulis BED1]